MRGVDLNVFAFDYDLTWAAFVIDADQRIYARYGSRVSKKAEELLSLAGLRATLRKALAAYRRGDRPPVSPAAPPRTVEQLPAARRLKDDACIHCHQVNDFRNEQAQAAGRWTRNEVWAYIYPPPATVGLTLDIDANDRVKAVAADSPAARAGLWPGDVLQRLNGRPVASIADVQYALHLAPPAGSVAVTWERGGREQTGTLELPAGWKRTDISWRASMWGLSPVPSVYGRDLEPEEKRQLGLSEKRLAFRQNTYVADAAKQAGIQPDDVILGLDGQELEMTMLQFNAHVRLSYNVGDTLVFDVIRRGKRLKVPMRLPGRTPTP
jgi:hypothetical protein